MNVERYSDLTKAILQAAQVEALGAGHARLEALHILHAMLSDAGGLAHLLVSNAGGDAELLVSSVQGEVKKLAVVSGDRGQLAL
ncbi:MAG: Clp protease N-terminal domain-containing protein, partial [Pseudomonadota bacterium]|nr:Clp protease N-terminal domain-containing protein [Pseudomonadota bacterium]